MALTIVDVAVLVAFGCYLVWLAVIHGCTFYHFRRRNPYPPMPGYAPSVSIIKPTKGVDQGAFENFASFCEQHYAGAYELVFCVEDPSDPAVAVIRQVIAAYGERRVRLVFSDPHDTRSFGKLKNMIVGVQASAHDVLIFSDSDARVGSRFVAETVACMRDPQIGLGFAAPAYVGAADWAAALRSVFVNELVLRITTLCVLGVFRGAIGTTMVTRKTVLREIGGLTQFGWQITDDIPLARRVMQHGYRVHLLAQRVRIMHYHDDWASCWAHAHRWLVMIRRYWPVLFVLMNLPDLAFWWGVTYVGIGLAGYANPRLALALVLAVLAAATVSAAVVNARVVRNRQLWHFFWLVPLYEWLRLLLVAYSWATNRVTWRGRTVLVAPDCSVRMVKWKPTHHHA